MQANQKDNALEALNVVIPANVPGAQIPLSISDKVLPRRARDDHREGWESRADLDLNPCGRQS